MTPEEKLQSAHRIIITEAEMILKGNRNPKYTIRWLKEAIELLEG